MATNELAVSIAIGAVLQGSFNTVIGRSVDQFNKVGDTIKRVEDKTAHLSTFRKLRSELTETDTAYRAAQDRVSALTREMRATDKPSKKLVQQLGAAKRQVGSLNQKLTGQRRALLQQRQAMAQAGVATTRLNQQEQQLGQTVDKLRAKYKKLGNTLAAQKQVKEQRAEKRGEMLDAAALGYAMAQPIRAAIQFESVMADVNKVVDFDSPAGLKQMGDDLLKMSTRIPMASTGLGEIMAAAGQAGIAREELLRFTEDAAKMGVAFDLTGKQAGAAMTGLRSIFKLNQDQVIQLGDVYNHLSNNMDAAAAGLLNIANRAGSTAALFGLSGQQLGALGATFLELKTAPEVAATGINAMLLKLATADKQGAKFQNALTDIGFSAEEMKDAIEEDAQGALLEFLETVKGSEDVMGTLSDLFGAEYSDDMAKLVGGLDSYKKALILSNDPTIKHISLQERMALVGAKTEAELQKKIDAQQSLQKEYEARSATTEANLQRFGGHMNRLGVTIGSVLLPALNGLLDTISPIIGSLVDLANEFPMVTQVVVGATVGLAVLKIGSIAVGYAFTFVKGTALALSAGYHTLTAAITLANTRLGVMNATMLVTAVRTKALAIGGALRAFGATLMSLASRAIPVVIGALRTLTVAMMTNPVGLIIGGIALGAGLLISNWSGVGEFFSSLWGGIKDAAAATFDWLSSKFETIAKLRDTVTGWFGDDDEDDDKPASKVVQFPSQALKPVSQQQKPGNVIDLAERRAANQQIQPMIAGNLALQAAPATAQAPQVINHNNYKIAIHQQPGQDPRALADLVIREIEQRQAQANRGGLYDE